jgi:hypothetical protein
MLYNGKWEYISGGVLIVPNSSIVKVFLFLAHILDTSYISLAFSTFLVLSLSVGRIGTLRLHVIHCGLSWLLQSWFRTSVITIAWFDWCRAKSFLLLLYEFWIQ